MIPEARTSVKVRTHNHESSTWVQTPEDCRHLKETAQQTAQFFPRTWYLAPRGYSLSELVALTHRLTLWIRGSRILVHHSTKCCMDFLPVRPHMMVYKHRHLSEEDRSWTWTLAKAKCTGAQWHTSQRKESVQPGHPSLEKERLPTSTRSSQTTRRTFLMKVIWWTDL